MLHAAASITTRTHSQTTPPPPQNTLSLLSINLQWNPSIVDTLGSWRSVLYTVEPLYCGHLGNLAKCPVYSGTPLLWTPWGPGEVSCIQWNPSIVDTLGSWRSVLYTVELLYCGHLGELAKCPVYSGTPLLWTPWGPGEVSCIQ